MLCLSQLLSYLIELTHQHHVLIVWQWTSLSWVHVMAWCLVSARPLPESVLPSVDSGTLRSKLVWNLDQNTVVLFEKKKNAFENIICKCQPFGSNSYQERIFVPAITITTMFCLFCWEISSFFLEKCKFTTVDNENLALSYMKWLPGSWKFRNYASF